MAMEIKPVYLFYGEETYLIARDLKIFRQYFSQRDCEIEEFDAVKDSLADILTAASMDPLFGSERLIIVSNSPWFAPSKGQSGTDKTNKTGENEKIKEERSAIEDYCSSPNENVCLVFTAPTAARTLKTVKAIMSVGKVREYKKPKEWELPAYLRQYLNKGRRRIGANTLDLLITIGGDDLGSLINECDKLILYTEGKDTVSEQDVLTVVSQGAAANMFQLSDALGNRDAAIVGGLVGSILGEMKPWEYMKLFGYITNYFRMLLRIKALSAEGCSESQIAKTTKINPYRIKLGIPASKKYTTEELIEALRLMAEVDYKMKSGQEDFAQSFPVALMAIAASF